KFKPFIALISACLPVLEPLVDTDKTLPLFIIAAAILYFGLLLLAASFRAILYHLFRVFLSQYIYMFVYVLFILGKDRNMVVNKPSFFSFIHAGSSFLGYGTIIPVYASLSHKHILNLICTL